MDVRTHIGWQQLAKGARKGLQVFDLELFGLCNAGAYAGGARKMGVTYSETWLTVVVDARFRYCQRGIKSYLGGFLGLVWFPEQI